MTKMRLNVKNSLKFCLIKSAACLLILGIAGFTTDAFAESASYNAQKVQDTRNYVTTQMVKDNGGTVTNVTLETVINDLSGQVNTSLTSLDASLNNFLKKYQCSATQTSGTASEEAEGEKEKPSLLKRIGIWTVRIGSFAVGGPIGGLAANILITAIDDDAKAIVNKLTSCGTNFKQCAKDGIFSQLLGKGFSWYDYASGYVSDCTVNPGQSETELFQERQKILEDAADADALVGQLAGAQKISGKNIEIYKHCTSTKKDESGKETCASWAYYALDTEDGSLTTLSAIQTGCEPLPFKLHEARSCLFCPLFNTIFNAIQSASNAAYAKLGKPLSTLIIIGLALWIALMVLQNVSSMTRQDPMEFITKLFRASFKVIIAFFMLKNSAIVTNIIIGPILKSGFDFGVTFLDHSGNSVLANCKAMKEYSTSAGGVLPGYIKTNLLCFVEAVQYELATSQAIGSSLMCISVHQGMGNLGPVARVWPDFNMMLQGALIYIISFILSIAFGFYLIDATVQLGIFGVVLPFLILCMPFKITESYFKTGVGVFMNSWFVYVFMGIVVNIVLELIGQSLTGGKGGFSEIEAAINGNNVRNLQQLLSIGFSGFLVLLACCVFAVKLMMKVTDLAGQFGGGGLNLGIGSNIGGLAASGATGLAKAAGQKAVGAVKGAANMKVWKGSDGQYKSLNDGLNNLKTKAARGVVSGARTVLSAPVNVGRNLLNAFRGSNGRRNPSE